MSVFRPVWVFFLGVTVMCSCSRQSLPLPEVRGAGEEIDIESGHSRVSQAHDGELTQRQRALEYIRVATERYQLPKQGVRMELRDTASGLRIFVLGHVQDTQSLDVIKRFFENPVTSADRPVPLIWQVTVEAK